MDDSNDSNDFSEKIRDWIDTLIHELVTYGVLIGGFLFSFYVFSLTVFTYYQNFILVLAVFAILFGVLYWLFNMYFRKASALIGAGKPPGNLLEKVLIGWGHFRVFHQKHA